MTTHKNMTNEELIREHGRLTANANTVDVFAEIFKCDESAKAREELPACETEMKARGL